MTEINTFSAAVDDVITLSGRPDKKLDIVSYLRVSMRECQVLRYFRNDMTEDTLTADASPYIWTYPQEFRILRTVRYPFLNDQGKNFYPPMIGPSKRQREEDYFYYGGPGYYAFAGIESGDSIDVSYYSNFTKLAYYTSTTRPATFSLENNAWSYLTATTLTDQEVARNQVSNWMLFNYYDTIVTGGLAKLLNISGDDRAKSVYSYYKSLQKDLAANEPSDSLSL